MEKPTIVTPPRPAKKPHRLTAHGTDVSDDYFWMRERENPEVVAHLHAENAYTEAVLKETKDLQKRLYDEMLARIKETDLSVPVRLAGYWYYSRTEEGKQYSIQCRKKETLEAREEILLDSNLLASGGKYFRLGAFRVSPNQKRLAFSTDTTGAESFTLFIKDLETGELFSDRVENTYASVEWGADNSTLFYTTLNESRRPHKLFRHSLGTPQSTDTLIFYEPDESYFLSIYKTRDQKWLVISLHSQVTSEAHILEADKPEDAFRLVERRREGVEYHLDHHDGRFFIQTNDGATNFKIVEAPASDPSRGRWKDFLPHRPSVLLEGFDVFKNFMAIYEREQGLTQIRILEPAGGQSYRIPFEEPVFTVWNGSNPEYDTVSLRYGYTSLVTPASVYDYDLKTRTSELKKRTEVLGGYDSAAYQSERVFARSGDGTRVPISIVYKKGLVKNGKSPLLLYGYGSYGLSTDPEFSSTRLSLLNRGFVYAIAHIRGGEEMGRAWYEDGKLLKKKNTFHDFIAAAEYLVAQNFTSPDRLAIYGGSAGGLLVGASVNMRPDLFGAVVAHVPFVDVIHTMLDKSLPLTVIEHDEWGNPEDKQYFDYMLSYSPYDNVARCRYPSMLITGGLNDPRVQYWEPAKWAAKLREMSASGDSILLKINMDAGHGGASGRYDALKEIALDYAFLFETVGKKAGIIP